MNDARIDARKDGKALAPIEIELEAPARVLGKPVRHQSLWILLRLWLAAQAGEGWVREAQLREQFASARNLRMVISRAYGDFARWGLRVGWGKDRTRDPDLLPLAGRNRGPYWLVDGEAPVERRRRHRRRRSVPRRCRCGRERLDRACRTGCGGRRRVSPCHAG